MAGDHLKAARENKRGKRKPSMLFKLRLFRLFSGILNQKADQGYYTLKNPLVSINKAQTATTAMDSSTL